MDRAGTAQIRAILGEFELWLDRQAMTRAAALHAHHAIAYLRMAEAQPLTPGCRANLARHVEAIGKSVL